MVRVPIKSEPKMLRGSGLTELRDPFSPRDDGQFSELKDENQILIELPQCTSKAS